jgi:hypothetical protein
MRMAEAGLQWREKGASKRAVEKESPSDYPPGFQARLAKHVSGFEIGLVHIAEITGELHSESPQSHTNGGVAELSA